MTDADPVLQRLAADHGRKYVLFELFARDHPDYRRAERTAEADDDFEDEDDPDMVAAKYAQAVDNLLGQGSLDDTLDFMMEDSRISEDIRAMRDDHGDEADEIMDTYA